MELNISSICDVNRQPGEFASGCSKRSDYYFGKVYFISEVLD